jgi:hypothetical protein
MTPEIDNVGDAILKGICNSESEDLAIELGEFEIGALLDEDVLKEIPIIKSVIACRKTWAAIQDQLFLRKVANFLRACPKFTQVEKENFLDKHLKNPKDAKHLGNTIVLVLDKFDDFDKPAMYTKLFAAHVRVRIDYDNFRRLGAAINSAFVGDLKRISSLPADPKKHSEKFLELLLPSGLTVVQGGETRLGAIGSSVWLSELGQLFQKCMLEE